MRPTSRIVRTLFVIAVCLGCATGAAQAGRRPFAVSYDTPMVPDGDVEIESWVDYLLNRQAPNQWRWWIGPRWAPFENFEVAAFTIVAQDLTRGENAAELWAEELHFRWRFFSHPVAGNLTLQLNTRIAMEYWLPNQLSPQLGWSTHAGRFGFAAQLGYAGGFTGPPQNASYHWIVWSAGVSFDVVRGEISPPFQLGIEAFGQGVLAGNNEFTGVAGSTVNLGPTLAISRGRLWLSIAGLVGLTEASPLAFVRGTIGVAL